MSAADSEAQKARFSDFVRQHPVLAAGSAIAAGGLAAYLAESNGLSLPVAAGIGVAGATSAVLLSSLAYLERPAYVQDHPYIAGFQFVGVTGVSAFFIEELSGGLVEIPIAVLLGSLFGVGAVALTAAGYDWIKGWLPSLPESVKTVAKDTATGVETVFTDPTVVSSGIANTADAISSGEMAMDLSDAVKGAFGYAGSDLDLDEISKNGTAEERALCAKLTALLMKKLTMKNTQQDDEQFNLLAAQLKKMLDDNHQDNWGRPMVSTADARFTSNHDNPVVQQERAEEVHDMTVWEEIQAQHKEEVDAFVEEVHDMTVWEEIQARAKALAQGPKK